VAARPDLARTDVQDGQPLQHAIATLIAMQPDNEIRQIPID
jgi:hypothetical protein